MLKSTLATKAIESQLVIFRPRANVFAGLVTSVP